ncbi:MAG: hypothetical protein ABJB40_13675 [Acidobacteriota bacterium]
MPKTPKEKPRTDDHEKDARDKASWSEDQKERGYYYDDAHGYEVYEPDEDEKEEAD